MKHIFMTGLMLIVVSSVHAQNTNMVSNPDASSERQAYFEAVYAGPEVAEYSQKIAMVTAYLRDARMTRNQKVKEAFAANSSGTAAMTQYKQAKASEAASPELVSLASATVAAAREAQTQDVLEDPEIQALDQSITQLQAELKALVAERQAVVDDNRAGAADEKAAMDTAAAAQLQERYSAPEFQALVPEELKPQTVEAEQE